jgi:hypothetical protein
MTTESKKKVAIFLGNDITSCIVFNRIIPELTSRGYEPLLVLPAHGSSKKAMLPQTQELAFVERKLLNEVYAPFLKANGFPEKASATTIMPPEMLALSRGYEVMYEGYNGSRTSSIKDVNSPEVIEKLKQDKEIVGAFSIRCFQIFKQPIIDMLTEKDAFFINFHPGVLPWLKGVMTSYWAQLLGPAPHGWEAPRFGCTAHAVTVGIDEGPVIAVKSKDFQKGQTGLSATIESASMFVKLASEILDSHVAGENISGTPQNKGQGGYYSYFTADDYREWRLKDLPPFFRKDEIIGSYVSMLGDEASSNIKRKLQRELESAFDKYQKSLVHSYLPAAEGTPSSATSLPVIAQTPDIQVRLVV